MILVEKLTTTTQGIQSVILSAAELGESTSVTADSLEAFSANANFAPRIGVPPIITFPLLQGMGFVTGVYKNGTPLIQTSVFFRDLIPVGLINNGATSKFRILLEDGKTWLLYLTPHQGQGMEQLTKTSNTSIQGRNGYVGLVQVARLPASCNEEIYDRSAGSYAVSASISGTAQGNRGQYTLSWSKAGFPNSLLM
jgi:endo-1,3(4)-beta-glucanase